MAQQFGCRRIWKKDDITIKIGTEGRLTGEGMHQVWDGRQGKQDKVDQTFLILEATEIHKGKHLSGLLLEVLKLMKLGRVREFALSLGVICTQKMNVEI